VTGLTDMARFFYIRCRIPNFMTSMLAYSKHAIATVFFVVATLSCNSPADEPFESSVPVNFDLSAIQERGYINALVDNNSFSYFIYKGKAMGYEYELLQLLAKELNVDLKIKVTSGVEEAIEQLNAGEGDILAFPLTINKPRKELVSFTRTQFTTYQVLVQRKPDNWRKMTADQIEQSLIRNPADLHHKDVHVIKGTSGALRIKNLTEELGIDVHVKHNEPSLESESLIQKVALGEIDYTIADHSLARVNTAYYPNLDIETVLGVPHQVAWAVRKNSPDLQSSIDDWMAKIKKEPTFMVIYNRYFKSPRTSNLRMQSDYHSLRGNKLSPYDDLIKKGAASLGWDWRFLASLIYQESRFEPQGESWAGAKGLMQLMPETAKQYGVTDVEDPVQNIHAGVKYLKYLTNYWSSRVTDSTERVKFVLASYNAGLAHVIDARKLAEKYGMDPNVWYDNVAHFMLKKSDPTYYQDPDMLAGYCRCQEPVNYVKDIFDRYDEYRMHIQIESVFDIADKALYAMQEQGNTTIHTR
jgi:membrane-bound lytic murein transglycosylase F